MDAYSKYSPVFISFILGITSAIIIQYLADRRKLKRIKGAILAHLKDSILPCCKGLIENYQLCQYILTHEHSVIINTFESFNTDLYKANHPSEYYKLFYSSKVKKDKFLLISHIYSLVSFLKENLPFEMDESYNNEIERHLDKHVKANENRNEHRVTCNICKRIQEKYNNLYDMRIEEVKKLEKLVIEFLK
ncbi:hypothetical protein [Mucilaginibacter flavus]|uniref:hypothetical protein n=1 Tax=Mucilaginibacter flavus TaxID=931504 RepID=UPI0025B5C710|nr:hypothetical protein [Mucilaginibacter flavus]MDN3582264.1 hypothetical protein [Mucilaginibacter flavus]